MDLARVATPEIPLERCIARLRAQCAIQKNVLNRQMQFGRVHPHMAAIEMAELQAALRRLEALLPGAAAPSSDDVGA